MDIQLLDEYKAKILGSPLLFTQVFYKARTGRDFTLSNPVGRESHFISISRALKKVFERKIKRLIINVPPRYGKSTLVTSFIAWCLAHYSDSQFIYASCSQSLATMQTSEIKGILDLPLYRQLFGVKIKEDSSAKHNFYTEEGGRVYAVGLDGTIVGHGAGLKNVDRFGGGIFIDDAHKQNQVNSDTIRETVIRTYFNTLENRINDALNTPIVFVGQRLHEEDLPAVLKSLGDWEVICLPALDENKNALYPEMHTREMLFKMQEDEPYNFAAQYQQDPQPAGGGIFKPEWFPLLDYEPDILATFITADTAETDKNYNDATVFSFWGIYKIKQYRHDPLTRTLTGLATEIETNLYGIHWIDCVELRVEPKDLHSEFMDFYARCMMHKVKPNMACIEKKSTGSTLISILSQLQGLQIVDIERSGIGNSKTNRFLQIQPYISTKRVSLPALGRHTKDCLEQARKITANNSHRFDDRIDTLYDAVNSALINEIVLRRTSVVTNQADDIVSFLARDFSAKSKAMRGMYGH